MRCAEARTKISEALDAPLDERAAQALDEHLGGCAECARFKADQERLSEALALVQPPEPTAQDAERTARRVWAALESTPETGSVFWGFRAVAIAAMVLMAVAVVFLSVQLNGARRQIAELSGQSPEEVTTAAAPTELHLPTAVPIPRAASLEKGLDQQVAAFREVQESLGGALHWLAIDGDQVADGWVSSGTVAKEVVLVSFQYLERHPGGSSTVLSSPQFVIAPGEEASVRFAGHGAAAGEMFRYRVRPTRVEGQIRAQVSFVREADENAATGEIAPRISAKVVVKDGTPMLLGARGDPSSQRELYMVALTRALPASEKPAEGKGSL